ncbi:hypothetical protein BV25DRAFT_1799959 [Artomyces pyxidatus]|uniref:Uncharacterized protein n=1 Tax=Artomyces pyxidatus TaxID=48021 RepID=A0ACB8T892_9AGAM|nr:hypothetical protein BV25DRAFT_1799959 [Artomyces pyxidatus]
MRVFTALTVPVAGATYAWASLYPTQPVANTVLAAGRIVTVEWMDDGKSPALGDLPHLRLELLGHGDTLITTIAPDVDPTSLSHQVWISPSLGGNSSDYYFRFAAENPQTSFYTSRFTLTGMAGSNASTAAASDGTTGAVVPLLLPNMTTAPPATSARPTSATMRSFTMSSVVGPPTSLPSGNSTGKEEKKQASSGERVDVEKLKFRLVFILWPALMGISMAL